MPTSEILPGMEALVPVIKQIDESKALTKQGRSHFTACNSDPSPCGMGEAQYRHGLHGPSAYLVFLAAHRPRKPLQYKRQNGPYKLVMIAGGDNKLPFGNMPRLLLAWVSTEAVGPKNDWILGSSLLSFIASSASSNSGGDRGDRTRLKNQIDRLFNATAQLIYERRAINDGSSAVADRTGLWWDYRSPEQDRSGKAAFILARRSSMRSSLTRSRSICGF